MTVARGEAAAAPVVVARGELHLAEMMRLHDRLLEAAWAGGQRVVLDLSAVTKWSVGAQAVLLDAARTLARSRSSLLLTGAGLGLRMQSQRLDVFTRVRALGQPAT